MITTFSKINILKLKIACLKRKIIFQNFMIFVAVAIVRGRCFYIPKKKQVSVSWYICFLSKKLGSEVAYCMFGRRSSVFEERPLKTGCLGLSWGSFFREIFHQQLLQPEGMFAKAKSPFFILLILLAVSLGKVFSQKGGDPHQARDKQL